MSAKRIEPRWINQAIVLAIHTDQVRQHGGSLGIRNQDLLESALQRTPNRWHYDDTSDFCALAAAYGMGLANNHPFIDGNKRTAFQVMYVFLGLNSLRIVATEPEVVDFMLNVASGKLKEPDLARWLREHTEAV